MFATSFAISDNGFTLKVDPNLGKATQMWLHNQKCIFQTLPLETYTLFENEGFTRINFETIICHWVVIGCPAQKKGQMRSYADTVLAPPFKKLVATTTEPFVQAILDLAISQMVFGRVALVGDAAFIPRPHTAASKSKARVLTLCIF